MKVLFVDDEPRVLEALERSLHIGGGGWETRFVNSGEAALAALDDTQFDVIVSDMRMPGMDGAALLAAVAARAPAMVRIVLSGQAEEASALRVVRVAHQFLAKPCDVKTLRQVVERTGALHRTLADPALRAMLGGVDRLPSALHVYQELDRLLAHDQVSTDAVTDVVRQDPAMASKLLQFANSSFFALSREIPDVRSAVIRLGTKTIKNLALALGVFDTVGKKIQPPLFSVEEMQRRSFAIAKMAAALADPALSDAAYIAGLVCDLGELVLASNTPERLASAWNDSTARNVTRTEAERAAFGVTHAEVGAYLLSLWGLPFRVIEAVALHHNPREGAQPGSGLVRVVWVAACVAAGEEPDPIMIQELDAHVLLQRARDLRVNVPLPAH